MARPFWSGQVQISLVSFGVNLYTATESKSQIQFHQIDRRTGERIRHQKVSEGAEDEGPVDRSDIVKGYEYSKGEYVTLEPKELEELRIPSKRSLAVQQFVDIREIDLKYFEKPYFVTPEDEDQSSTFKVFRKALAETGKAGLGEIAFGGREHLVALTAADGGKDSLGMVAYVMRYPEELRSEAPIFAEITATKIDADQLALAKELIRRNSAKFNPSQFTDDYEAAVRELVEAKLHHRKIPKATAPTRGKVINLTDALRQSLAAKRDKSAAPGRAQAATTRAQAKRKGPVSALAGRGRRRMA